MERPPVGMDELVEHWTVLCGEQDLIETKHGATRLGFTLVLKFYTRYGRFPRGRAEFPDEVVEHVARQLKASAADFEFYGWAGRTIERHRGEIRSHLGFRECSVADADKLTDWLAASVAYAERDPDRVRVELLKMMREERIELPADGRVGRMVASALRTAEQNWFAAIAARLDAAAMGRVLGLAGWGEDTQGEDAEDEPEDPESVLALIKSMPGSVSLESMLTEIRKLKAARGIGLPARLFSDVVPKVLAGWRARCAIESPSHLPRCSAGSAATLLAALVHDRLREITDDLTELLIATVHRIDARAHKKVTDELVNAFKRVDGKENLLFQIAEAALSTPDGAVSQVVYPAVRGPRVQDQGPGLPADRADHAQGVVHQPLPQGHDRPARRAGVPLHPRRPPAAGRPGGDQAARQVREPDLLPARRGRPAAQGHRRGLGAPGVPHRPARQAAHGAHGLRGRHVPRIARDAAVQGDLGRRGRPVPQPGR
jgi:hypothetical protein